MIVECEKFRGVYAEILEWFARRGRKFPWRGEVGWYGVLVAEFMLIRTRSEVAERVFLEFMRAFPSPEQLCSSGSEGVVGYFRKLGLPSRAERLVSAVCSVLSNYGGAIPCDYSELRKLPGVGDYISRVLLSRVCGKDYAFVDSNVARVLLRFTGKLLKVSEASQILERAFSGEDLHRVNIALLDLGSLVCTPVKPRCPVCPIKSSCSYYVGSPSSV